MDVLFNINIFIEIGLCSNIYIHTYILIRGWLTLYFSHTIIMSLKKGNKNDCAVKSTYSLLFTMGWQREVTKVYIVFGR